MAYPENKNNIQPLPPRTQFGGEGALSLVGGLIGRAAKVAPKIIGAFANTAKQYFKGFKNPKPPTSTFKPFHRDGKTFSREAIEEAFKRGL